MSELIQDYIAAAANFVSDVDEEREEIIAETRRKFTESELLIELWNCCTGANLEVFLAYYYLLSGSGEEFGVDFYNSFQKNIAPGSEIPGGTRVRLVYKPRVIGNDLPAVRLEVSSDTGSLQEDDNKKAVFVPVLGERNKGLFKMLTPTGLDQTGLTPKDFFRDPGELSEITVGEVFMTLYGQLMRFSGGFVQMTVEGRTIDWDESLSIQNE